MKECIHLFKYRHKLSLAGFFGRLLVQSALNVLDINGVDLILPVPLHRAKRRQREFNQAELLARALAGAFSKKLGRMILIKTRPTAPQAGLRRAERMKNIQGCFQVKRSQEVLKKHILLVDDVLTTGATVNECIKVLKQAGAEKVEVLTLARSI